MGILSSFFGFKPQPDDVKMLVASRAAKIPSGCNCFSRPNDDSPFQEVRLHSEAQDKECDAWKLLKELVEKAASNRSKEFAPGLEMSPEMWSQIVTLPRSIRARRIGRIVDTCIRFVGLGIEVGATRQRRPTKRR